MARSVKLDIGTYDAEAVRLADENARAEELAAEAAARQERTDHVIWCKSRAMVYLRFGLMSTRGDLMDAVTSMMSDLYKHEAIKGAGYRALHMLGVQYANAGSYDDVLRWIEGFD